MKGKLSGPQAKRANPQVRPSRMMRPAMLRMSVITPLLGDWFWGFCFLIRASWTMTKMKTSRHREKMRRK